MDEFMKSRIIQPSVVLYEAILRRNSNQSVHDLLAKKKQDLSLIKDRLIIPRIVLVIGTKCSLKCKDCANLMQHYDEPYDLSIEDVISGCEDFFQLIDECMEMNVIGGEPFLYKDLDKLMEYLLSNEKIDSIMFTTNGTVIPNESVLKLMENKKTFVRISDYGNVRVLANFVSVLDKYDICSELICDVKWIDCGNVIKRNRTKEEIKDMYISCDTGKMCKTLLKGKIFDCPRAAHLYDLGYADDVDYIEIKGASPKEILDFWLKETSGACDYCDFSVKPSKVIEPAIQVNGTHINSSKYILITRKNYSDIVAAKEYWEKEFYKSEDVVKELQKWSGELEDAKTYFIQQIENLQKENMLLRERISKE